MAASSVRRHLFCCVRNEIGSELRNIALILDEASKEVACQIMKEVTDTLVHLIKDDKGQFRGSQPRQLRSPYARLR